MRVKLVGFAISAYIAGIGGSLLAYYQPRVTFASYSAIEGLNVFTTAFLAGITAVAGAVATAVIALGGIVYIVFDRAIDFGNWYVIISGLGLIVAVIFNPEGIAGAMKRDLGGLYRKVRNVQPAAPVALDLADVPMSEFAVASPGGSGRRRRSTSARSRSPTAV